MSKVGDLVRRIPYRQVIARINKLDRTPRLVVKSLIAVFATLVLLAGVMLFVGPPLSESEQAAVDASTKAASGFKKDSEGYSFTQFNKAVEFAYEGKCTEARAVYSEAAKHPNGLPSADIRAYNKRIEDICSGKVTPPPARNDY